MRNPFRKTGKRELNLPKNLSKAQEKEILQIIRKARSDDGIPRSAQDSIPFQRMFPDGICRVTDRYYTLTIQYQDINYQLAQQEDKTAIFEEWCAFLNSFDSSIHFELSFMNMATDAESFEKKVRIPYRNDRFNGIRNEYSQMLRTQLAQGNNGLTKTKYITFGIEADSMREAKPRLRHVQTDMMNNLKRLGVSAKVLNGRERLKLMHAMFHMVDHDRFYFDWSWLVGSGLSVKEFIAPTSFSFPGSRTFTMGDLKGAMSYLQITASDLSDQMLKDFLDMESSQIVTMHIQSVNQTTAIKQIKHTITELDRSKIEEQKKAVRSGYDMDIIPSDLATYGKDAKALLEELQSQNERMFLITFLIMNTGKTDQELENNVFQASSIAQKHNCNLRRLDFQQEQGLMSSLPLANNLIEIQRALTTSSTAIFVPFTTQELFQTGSEALYYGLNALSNNLIMVDRKKLKNPNGLILGTPGSGKSFSAKREIANAFLVTDDDLIICDPEAEYTALVNCMEGQVIKISPTSTQYINPMDINDSYSEEDNPLALKADFILSLCELVVGGKDGLQPIEKTVIDRCVHQVYQHYFEEPKPENMPLLEDLYNALLKQEETEAKRVAAALEIYVKGSLNLFNHRTNVDIQNRFICYDIKELGKQLKKLGMLIVQDQVWGRVTANRSAGKTTRYYMDEFHLLLKEEQTASYSVEIWKRFRKWGGIPTGITQNVKDLLSSREVENIFENSDFVYMLNQAAGDRQILAQQLNISPHQLSYVTHSGEGEGLLFYGNVILPFVDRFPTDLQLYKIMTTKLSEVQAAEHETGQAGGKELADSVMSEKYLPKRQTKEA
ncbi:VirB4-like conjugal transfer ATPase, CD1110 family [Stomatobaculum longum]|uniref:VirB4-like conjugal transfer ATPase, CD1110 family n=1 Tax=Stomatobaculum longum TaxID=796942 RepID=UPI002FE6D3A7